MLCPECEIECERSEACPPFFIRGPWQCAMCGWQDLSWFGDAIDVAAIDADRKEEE
jgi:hypothetical protein